VLLALALARLLTEVPWASDGGGTVPRTLNAFWLITCANAGTAGGERAAKPRPNKEMSFRYATTPTTMAMTTTLIAPWCLKAGLPSVGKGLAAPVAVTGLSDVGRFDALTPPLAMTAKDVRCVVEGLRTLDQ
jgi:hypothetical protein